MRRKHYNYSRYREAYDKFARVANEAFRDSEDSLMLLCLQKGATYKEIGDALEVSKQAIDMRVRKIRALREREAREHA